MAGFRDSQSGRRRKTGQEPLTRSREEWQQLCGEFNICKRKLQAKSDALLVLAKELDNVRQEKDAYKLMAEQLREKFHEQRKKYEERERALGLSLHDGDPLAERRNHTLVQILCELRAKNRKGEQELVDLRQKLSEAEGDIKLLRESIARQRIGDEGIGTRHFPAHEREELIRQIETSRERIESLERDMVAKIDDQQEFVTERDYYRTKTERLNQELNYVLGGDDRRIVDVDALVMENKYLKERMNQSLEEKATLQATINKYKTALERRRGKGLGKPGGGSGAVLSTKDVEKLLAQGKSGGISSSPSSVGDLQALATSLLETVHDKNMVLSHQKNTNKILGKRVAELEKKLKTLEVAGLWTLPAGSGAGVRNAAYLAKEKESMASGLKTLLPHQVSSSSSDDSPRSLDGDSSQGSSTRSTPHSTPSHTSNPPRELLRKDTEDSLILLEEVEGRTEATEALSGSQISPSHIGNPVKELVRKDTKDSLILLEEEKMGRTEATEARLRSHSSPSKRSQSEWCGIEGDKGLIEFEGKERLTKIRSKSENSASHNCHQNEFRTDHENKLLPLEDNNLPSTFGEEYGNLGDNWRVAYGEKGIPSDDDFGSDITKELNNEEASGGGDAPDDAVAERDLLRNIFEIEQGRLELEDSVNGEIYNEDKEDVEKGEDADALAAIELDDVEGGDDEEGDRLISSRMGLDPDPSSGAASHITTGSLENILDSVTEKLSLKSKEKKQLEGKEPSSPRLKREKQPSLVVVDNTPQCV